LSHLSVVTDQTYAPLFAEFVAKHYAPVDFPDTHYIASVLVNDENQVEEIVGVTALNKWAKGSCEAHAATDRSKRSKFDRKYIWTVFDYAFNHAGKNCMVTHVSVDNSKSQQLQKLLGLRYVGLVRGYYGEGKDAELYSITKQQWLDGQWGSLEATQGDKNA
jgi:hypothetical protein